MTDMIGYYAKRAREYEYIYNKPERQGDLRRLENQIAGEFKGLDVLEVACGTGYWTQFASNSAASILAADYNEEVLEIARSKDYRECPVEFLKSDAYELAEVEGLFPAGLTAFWWSHVLRADLPRFLRAFHSKLKNGAHVVVMDNRYVKGSSTPISRTDAGGNTYQERVLIDGSRHEVLKNFPGQSDFAAALDGFGEGLVFEELPYYWIARYKVKK